MSVEHITALRQCVQSMLDAAKQDYFRAVDLSQEGKCSPLRLAFLQGQVDGIERVFREIVHAETAAKGGEK